MANPDNFRPIKLTIDDDVLKIIMEQFEFLAVKIVQLEDEIKSLRELAQNDLRSLRTKKSLVE